MGRKVKRTTKSRKSGAVTARSAKAGKPPKDVTTRPQVMRRQRSAHAAYHKDAVIEQSAEGPYRVWGISRPKEKTTESRKGRRS